MNALTGRREEPSDSDWDRCSFSSSSSADTFTETEDSDNTSLMVNLSSSQTGVAEIEEATEAVLAVPGSFPAACTSTPSSPPYSPDPRVAPSAAAAPGHAPTSAPSATFQSRRARIFRRTDPRYAPRYDLSKPPPYGDLTTSRPISTINVDTSSLASSQRSLQPLQEFVVGSRHLDSCCRYGARIAGPFAHAPRPSCPGSYCAFCAHCECSGARQNERTMAQEIQGRAPRTSFLPRYVPPSLCPATIQPSASSDDRAYTSASPWVPLASPSSVIRAERTRSFIPHPAADQDNLPPSDGFASETLPGVSHVRERPREVQRRTRQCSSG